jgi:hypothetical protein
VGNDVVQVDLGDLDGYYDVRASVGAFPQPFTGGLVGARFPVKVECAPTYERACRSVRLALRAAGVDDSGQPPPQRRLSARVRRDRVQQPIVKRARILVGPWTRWRHRRWPHLVDRGPGYSGVFAQPRPSSRSMRLLDWNGNVSRALGPGAGLVAAMCPAESEIQWLVTGVDRKGVERASRSLDADTLRDAFAVAVTDNGIQKLPLPPKPGSPPNRSH